MNVRKTSQTSLPGVARGPMTLKRIPLQIRREMKSEASLLGITVSELVERVWLARGKKSGGKAA